MSTTKSTRWVTFESRNFTSPLAAAFHLDREQFGISAGSQLGQRCGASLAGKRLRTLPAAPGRQKPVASSRELLAAHRGELTALQVEYIEKSRGALRVKVAGGSNAGCVSLSRRSPHWLSSSPPSSARSVFSRPGKLCARDAGGGGEDLETAEFRRIIATNASTDIFRGAGRKPRCRSTNPTTRSTISVRRYRHPLATERRAEPAIDRQDYPKNTRSLRRASNRERASGISS